jgi:beta-galactosidase GanA
MPFKLWYGAWICYDIATVKLPTHTLIMLMMTQIPWNVHESVRGNYTFDGQADIVKFFQTAADVFIILCPPHIIVSFLSVMQLL